MKNAGEPMVWMWKHAIEPHFIMLVIVTEDGTLTMTFEGAVNSYKFRYGSDSLNAENWQRIA